MNEVNVQSAVSLPIELFTDENKISCATAFFMNHNDELFLVSNWHVFSGRNCYSGQPIHRSGAIPNRLRISIHTPELGSYHFGRTLDLHDSSGTPNWMQHLKGQVYDIACIRIADLPTNMRIFSPYERNCPEFRLAVASDVQIIGFPRGFVSQGIWPVWKRGTIAAEPDIPRHDELPIYLVDTATREGMSGAPAYLYSNGIFQMENGSSGVANGHVSRFLGIYSGRHGAKTKTECNWVEFGRKKQSEKCL